MITGNDITNALITADRIVGSANENPMATIAKSRRSGIICPDNRVGYFYELCAGAMNRYAVASIARDDVLRFRRRNSVNPDQHILHTVDEDAGLNISDILTDCVQNTNLIS